MRSTWQRDCGSVGLHYARTPGAGRALHLVIRTEVAPMSKKSFAPDGALRPHGQQLCHPRRTLRVDRSPARRVAGTRRLSRGRRPRHGGRPGARPGREPGFRPGPGRLRDRGRGLDPPGFQCSPGFCGCRAAPLRLRRQPARRPSGAAPADEEGTRGVRVGAFRRPRRGPLRGLRRGAAHHPRLADGPRRGASRGPEHHRDGLPQRPRTRPGRRRCRLHALRTRRASPGPAGEEGRRALLREPQHVRRNAGRRSRTGGAVGLGGPALIKGGLG